jgi:hypothetical protein
MRYVGNQINHVVDTMGLQSSNQVPINVAAQYAIRYGRATSLAEQQAIARELIEMLATLSGRVITLEQAMEALNKKTGTTTLSPPITVTVPEAISVPAEVTESFPETKSDVDCDARKKKCEELYNKYKYDNYGNRIECPSCLRLQTIPQCISSLVCFTRIAGLRQKYIMLKCDYYLDGSIRVGSKTQEDGHIQELNKVFKAMENCSDKIFKLTFGKK